jgi:hypothetical protein
VDDDWLAAAITPALENANAAMTSLRRVMRISFLAGLVWHASGVPRAGKR